VLDKLKSVTIIVPVYNEADVIPEFAAEMKAVTLRLRDRYRFEFLFVDDGSTDDSISVLSENYLHESARVLSFTRNFGKEAALAAGLDHAPGDAVIIIDVDLQDPPELIEQFLSEWEKGNHVVYGVRTIRRKDSVLKRFSAGIFYWMFNQLSDVQIPKHAGDFRLLDKTVVSVFRQLPERARFTKGLYAWAGFRSLGVPYERPRRKKGETKWSYWRLWNLALDGILSFSHRPLRIFTYTGLITSLASLFYAASVVFKAIFLGIETKGYASLMTAITFLGGLQLLLFGVLGEYLGRIFVEVKQRPNYMIMHDSKLGEAECDSAFIAEKEG